MSIKEIVIPFPDDFHLHLRDDDALALTVPHAANSFKRATVMPNLQPAVDTVDAALRYKSRIQGHIPEGIDFQPLMTLYLTPSVNVREIEKAYQAGIKSVKLYPQGATTNSSQGVSDIHLYDDVFALMAEKSMRLLIHGEVSDSSVDIFHRESVFVTDTLTELIQRHPKLKIVMEHITTKVATDFCLSASSYIAATITPQHLLANRNHLLSGGIKPHFYCLPILKKESDRLALLQAATSGNPKFFLGTDSAPHATSTKESACGCAGCYSAFNALEYYAQAFDSVDKLSMLENFSSRFGADFYELPHNTDEVRLVNQPFTIANEYSYLNETITPLFAGETLSWSRSNL